jgi:hypothetical protein
MLAQSLTAPAAAHIGLAAGRLTVTASDGRRCHRLLAEGADGPATLFLLDGDACAGGPGRAGT